MLKGQNWNRPQKGDQIKVDPIKKRKDIENIKKLLADNARGLSPVHPRNQYQSPGIRSAEDQGRAGERPETRGLNPAEGKKDRQVPDGHSQQGLHSGHPKIAGIKRRYADDDLLFLGQRGPLTVPSVHRLVKGWCRGINLKGNYGSHTLRKTFGYHQRVTFGTDIPRLMVVFNHSTQRQTLDYLCIQPEEIKGVYENEL